jgi:23S rRNA pseudouridine2605 synthase
MRSGGSFGPRRDGPARPRAPRADSDASEPLTLALKSGDAIPKTIASKPASERKKIEFAAPAIKRKSASSSASSASSEDAPIIKKKSEASGDAPALKRKTSVGASTGAATKTRSFRADKEGADSKFGRKRVTSMAKSVRLTEKPKIVKRGQVGKQAEAASEEILETMRLNRFISSAGVTSRRKADNLIEQGKVTINGKIVKELGVQVKPYQDLVVVNGETISLKRKQTYLLMNKPKDTITTTSDEFERNTVLDLVSTHERVYPVGRLDRNTTGVLLLTNDGELTNRLTHPKFEIEREYHVTLDKRLEKADAKKIAEGGIDLGEGDITGPADLAVAEADPKDIIMKIHEGKNREIRRLFEIFGYDVKKLDRVTFAGLTHRGMSRGEVRPLTPSEVRKLKKLAGISDKDY